jgi:predicted MFS family arabinose efflux permease
MFFFLSQFLQGVLLFSPLEAGLAFLPLTALLFGMARVVPRLMDRVGPARLMITGSVLIVAGMLWLTRIGEGSSYLGSVIGPMVLFGFGAGQIFIPLVSRAVSGVQPQDAGAASGLLNVIQQVGGALGLAILVTVYGTSSRSAAAAGDTVHALAEGIGSAFEASLVFAVLTLIVVVVSLRPWVRTAAASTSSSAG